MVTLASRIATPRTLLDERGASAVEYGLLVALIAAVVVLAVGILGLDLSDIYGTIADKIGDATS
jgi:pilus assembly protein Flp/PilA